MSRTTSLSIGEPLDQFVKEMVRSGRYGSNSEVVRSALRLLEQQEKQMDALRSAIDEGDESGESSLSLKEIAARKKAELNV